MPSISASFPELFALVAEQLSNSDAPVITNYELGKLVFKIVASEQIPSSRVFYDQVLDTLQTVKLLTPHKDFKAGSVFSIFGKMHPSPKEVACTVDPYAYVTHLSAMEYHGLTDRFPKMVYLCTPPAREWNEHAKSKQVKDLGDQIFAYNEAGYPPLLRSRMTRIDGVTIQVLARSKLGAFKTIKGPPLRVATIGRTFLDMLREPEDCGGIQHVIDAYKDNAKRYLSLIADEVERNGTQVDKVRCGYLLTEVCHLAHPIFDSWARFAQRGGSRKLDAANDYANAFSERWQLSLNVPSLTTESSSYG